MIEVVTAPEPVESAPEFRDPYVKGSEPEVRPHGTLATRTGSAGRLHSDGKGGDGSGEDRTSAN